MMMKKKDKKVDHVLRKKRYENPKLTIYGNINQLTKAVGNMGLPDGGTGKKHAS
jgi:hypothetical protein